MVPEISDSDVESRVSKKSLNFNSDSNFRGFDFGYSDSDVSPKWNNSDSDSRIEHHWFAL